MTNETKKKGFDMLRDKAKEIKTKSEAEKKEKKSEEVKKEVKAEEKALVAGNINSIEQNKELADMYNGSSKVGSENLSGSLPLLKIHASGRSTTNELLSGKEPNDGYFFYKPTQEQFEKVRCHILTISRGFRTERMNKKPGQKDTFNQLMAGVILNDNNFKPFIMFVTGKRLSPMWDFGKLAGKYTRRKPVSIPMFALTVDLSTHKEKVTLDNGMSSNVHVMDFEIEKNKDGSPVLVTDSGEFQYLRDSVQGMNDMFEQIITSKEINEENADDARLQENASEVFEGEEVKKKDDVPF